MKLYGSHLCKDCPKAIEYLEDKNYDFEYIDISNNIIALKEFLILRDTHPAFLDIKKSGIIGIPALLDENKVYIDSDIYSSF